MEPDEDLLALIHIASACSASWDAMEGGARVRFCTQCEKNVYNLSGMSRREAQAFLRAREGRLCVRFYRRRDGTVLTDDCPVGLRAARRWLLTHIFGLSAILGGLLGLPLKRGLQPAVMGFARPRPLAAPPTATPGTFLHALDVYAADPNVELSGRKAQYTLNRAPWPPKLCARKRRHPWS